MSLQVATDLLDEFTDGVCFVQLASISDPDFVFSTITRSLGLREAEDLPPFEHVQAALQNKHLLLVLDNFEQVLAAAAGLVELLTTCPTLKLLVTSRAVLHIRGEYEFPLAPLALPDLSDFANLARLPDNQTLSCYAAIVLFIQRAQAISPNFQLTEENARAIAELCVRLDGLPLALELAATRIKLLPPQALLARLGQRLQLLTNGAHDVLLRQQTLRNTIKWSYDLLNAQEQRLFRRLSVFAGGCTLEAAEAVSVALGDVGTHILDNIASLIDKSLLQPTQQKGDEPRLVMLATISIYGLECLDAHGEQEEVRRAHADYFLNLAQEAQFHGTRQVEWLERCEREHENLRAALHWLEAQQEVEAALCLAEALWQFWWIRGYWTEGRNVLERILASSREVRSIVRARALNAAGVLAFFQGDLATATRQCEDSFAMFQTLNDAQGSATCLYRLGQISWMAGNLAAAHALVEEAVLHFKEGGDRQGVADALMVLGYVFMDQGEYSKACSLLEESLAICTERGDKGGISASLVTLARISFLQGDLAIARKRAEQCLVLSKEVSDRWSIGHAQITMAYVAFLQGEHATTQLLCEEALLLFKALGDREGVAMSLHGLGWVAFMQADYAKAHALCEESLSIAIKLGHKEFMAFFPDGLIGAVAAEGAQGAQGAEGQAAWAAQLLGASEAFREAIGMPLPPVLQFLHEQVVTVAHAQLSEEAFASAYSEGRAMTIEQAIAAQGRSLKPKPLAVAMVRCPSFSRPPLYPAGLTAREVEVLRYTAMGLTNIQIGAKLIISARTVSTHLSSIYNKLGVATRSAATRFAAEHRLIEQL